MIFALVLALLPCDIQAATAAQDKIFAIGFASVGSESSDRLIIDGISKELESRRLTRGKHFEFVRQSLDSEDSKNIEDVLPKLDRRNVDVILIPDLELIKIVAKHPTRAPVLFNIYANAVDAGLSATFAEPTRRMTGLSSFVDLDLKRIELLRIALASRGPIGVLVDVGDDTTDKLIQKLTSSLLSKQGRISYIEVSSAKDFSQIAAKLTRLKLAGLYVPAHNLFSRNIEGIVAALAPAKIPVMYESGRAVRKGGLMAYEINFLDVNSRLADMIILLRDGTPVSRIPIEQPKSFSFVLNLSEAARIGWRPRPELLSIVSEVVN